MLFYSVVVFCLFAFFSTIYNIWKKCLFCFNMFSKCHGSEYPRIYLFIDFISQYKSFGATFMHVLVMEGTCKQDSLDTI